jgi:hypothetical protein
VELVLVLLQVIDDMQQKFGPLCRGRYGICLKRLIRGSYSSADLVLAFLWGWGDSLSCVWIHDSVGVRLACNQFAVDQ